MAHIDKCRRRVNKTSSRKWIYVINGLRKTTCAVAAYFGQNTMKIARSYLA